MKLEPNLFTRLISGFIPEHFHHQWCTMMEVDSNHQWCTMTMVYYDRRGLHHQWCTMIEVDSTTNGVL